MQRPEPAEYDPYYETYISIVPEDDILSALAGQQDELRSTFASIPEEKGLYSYAEGKWTIKEVLSHLIDGERIFGYRAFRISRGDKTPIEGFEQDGYIENSYANQRSFGEMLDEFDALRRSNLAFLGNMRDGDWARTGTANNVEISVRALAYIMAGHIRHHLAIHRSRYLA
jgi:hypothetical protein